MTKQPKRTHRLPYGEGSFRWDERRQLWRGRLDAGYTSSGKRRQLDVTGKDEDRAWAKLMAKKKALEEGTLTSSAIERMTVAEWSATWISEHQKRVRPSTFTGELGYLNKWILPAVGSRQLRDLSPRDLRAIEDLMRRAGRSSTTIRSVQRQFQRIVKSAKAEGLIVPDTVLLAKAVGKAVSDRDAIPLEDALRLLEVASSRPDAARWVAALLQGMRQGECLGLTWEAVDLETGTIDISWQLQTIPYEDRAAGTFRTPDGYEARHLEGTYHLVRPKTVRGYRIIPLVPWMVSALEAWREVAPASPHGLVWPRPDGSPQSSRMDSSAWKDLQREAGVSKGEADDLYVLHEARHTTATLLLAAGVDPEVIKAILGHSDIVTSRGYQHVNQAMTRAAMLKVAKRLGLES